ncbi:hypothetical protein NL676_013463 [Syzygium grande]|nr:hypothetical protein NL676_013463 [Syzygium grande]
MLFHRGKFLNKVTPRPGDKVFLYTQLGKEREWKLSLEDDGQVIGGPGSAAGQTSSGANAAGPQIESQLQGLKEEVEKLKKGLKALLDGIADLEKALAQR